MQITEVKNSKDYKQFLDLPDKIYGQNSKYVRPLDAHIKMMVGKLGKPEKHLLLAKDNTDNCVARLGVKVHKHGDKKELNWGFFECIEGSQDAVKKLFDHAQSLYPDFKMIGPYHFRMEDPYIGMLIEGYDRDPSFLMTYNPPYYEEYINKAGLNKVMELFTYELRSESPLGESIHLGYDKAIKNGVTVRAVNRKKMRQEADSIQRIFNDALSKNWGFEEFLDEQIDEMVTMMRFFLNTDVVTIAEKDGKAVGCLIMIPNYNPILKKSNGKITPRFLWNFFTGKKRINLLRGYALGVKKEAHSMGIGSLLVKDMYQRGPSLGFPRAELSWVLANNGPMNELTKAMNGQFDKKYGLFERPAISQ